MTDLVLPPTMKPMFYKIGGACLLIALAWVIQAIRFTEGDIELSEVVWIIMSAIVAGLGAGFILAGRYWIPRLAAGRTPDGITQPMKREQG